RMNAKTEIFHLIDPATLPAGFAAVRAHNMTVAEPLSSEDCCAQSKADASPIKWRLAHTTWIFETFIIARCERSFRAFDPSFRVLFNSYYNGVGERHARPQRGLLTRPSLQEVHAYRRHVDERVHKLLSPAYVLAMEDRTQLANLVELGLQHEQQH